MVRVETLLNGGRTFHQFLRRPSGSNPRPSSLVMLEGWKAGTGANVPLSLECELCPQPPKDNLWNRVSQQLFSPLGESIFYKVVLCLSSPLPLFSSFPFPKTFSPPLLWVCCCPFNSCLHPVPLSLSLLPTPLPYKETLSKSIRSSNCKDGRSPTTRGENASHLFWGSILWISDGSSGP